MVNEGRVQEAKPDEFDVRLTMGVSVKKQGEDGEWYSQNTDVTYTNMDYLQVAAMNAAILKFGEILTNLGWDAAELKGFPKQVIDAVKASIAKA